MFWHRLHLAGEIMNLVNIENEKKRLLETGTIEEDNVEVTPVFRTHFATMIWDIMSKYPVLKKTAFIALSDAEKYQFDICSSIKDDEDTLRLGKALGFEKLKKTRLLQHTYHVVWYASKFTEKAGGNMPSLLLLALLHDFGKHGAIKELYKISTNVSHEMISANYASSIMKTSGDFSDEYIEIIERIMSTHHTSPVKGVLLYDLLNEADRLSRILEKR